MVRSLVIMAVLSKQQDNQMETEKSVQDVSQKPPAPAYRPDIEIVIRFEGNRPGLFEFTFNPLADSWAVTIAMNPAKFTPQTGIARTFDEAFAFCQDMFLSRVSKAKRQKVAIICQQIQVAYTGLLAPTLLHSHLS